MGEAVTEIGVREFRGKLSEYLRRARNGERIVVQTRGKNPLQLTRIAAASQPRKAGRLKGQFELAEGWNEWPDGFLDEMCNGPIFPDETK